MSFRQLVKNTFRPIVRPLLEAIAERVASSGPQRVEKQIEFDLRLLSTLRSLAASGDHRVLLPYDSARPQKDTKTIKIGLDRKSVV